MLILILACCLKCHDEVIVMPTVAIGALLIREDGFCASCILNAPFEE